MPLVDLRLCGVRAGDPVRTSVGLTMTPDHGLEALADVDLVAVPATNRRGHDPAVLAALRAAHARGATLLSVCSGVFVLAEAGVLAGRTVATHWRHAEELAAAFPELRVDADVLFVDEGDLVTSAGTAAGIDACLHLVRREHGAAAANAIARRMVVPPQRDGGQRQFVPQPVPACSEDSLRLVLEWVLEHLDADHSVESLAARALVSPRTFARRFVAETGTTPVRWLTAQRVLRAQHLLEGTDLPVELVARECGFASAPLLRHHFRRAVGVSPSDYRTTFRSRAA
ncbi:putative transcription regulator, AraC family protein [Cellulomonas marina]|uniref:Transcriptional regulator GlxA family, contains an amidase domain and an AraC-type DNA-binding HTH domain n=1 Tax=Cellulomonas marina TaxID=988821 RepID=A0A1I0ZGU9_9CELL|nr:putative transcription regulator, AraC family protein [Cellulomonas marina]SFB24751.1 Transcriptional regulator GlxA family, contains an amidase domain and an AraC-type DNA-binding HTH domain [Cellulomonas marina]